MPLSLILLSFTDVKCKHSLVDTVQKIASVTNRVECWICIHVDEELTCSYSYILLPKQFGINPLGCGHIPNALVTSPPQLYFLFTLK